MKILDYLNLLDNKHKSKRKYFLIYGALILFVSPLKSQVGNDQINSNSLNPITIDTINERTLIVHNKYATIYFYQSDIKNYVEHFSPYGLPSKENFPIINAILKSTKKRIDLNDWKIENIDEERKENFSIIKEQGIDQLAMMEMSFIGNKLFQSGKFMIRDIASGEINCPGLKMVGSKSESGIRTIMFQLPSGQSFWRIITAIGD
jgi:hypothetical protein